MNRFIYICHMIYDICPDWTRSLLPVPSFGCSGGFLFHYIYPNGCPKGVDGSITPPAYKLESKQRNETQKKQETVGKPYPYTYFSTILDFFLSINY